MAQKNSKKKIKKASTGTEFHPPFFGYNYLGPLTNLLNRLSFNYEKQKSGYNHPATIGDKIAFGHDLAYASDSSIVKEYADRVMIQRIEKNKKDMKWYDKRFAWGIIPVRDLRRIRDIILPVIGFGVLGYRGVAQFMEDMRDLVLSFPNIIGGPAITTYSEVWRRGIPQRYFTPEIRAAMMRYIGIGNPYINRFYRELFFERLANMIPYIAISATAWPKAVYDEIKGNLDGILDILNTKAKAPATTDAVRKVERAYNEYLRKIGDFENGVFILKKLTPEEKEDAIRTYEAFYNNEVKEYFNFINEQNTEDFYELPELNKENLRKEFDMPPPEPSTPPPEIIEEVKPFNVKNISEVNLENQTNVDFIQNIYDEFQELSKKNISRKRMS
jgi:hypothetical protein